jgi:hypothetical protein
VEGGVGVDRFGAGNGGRLNDDFFSDIERLRLPIEPPGTLTSPTTPPKAPARVRVQGEFLKGPIPQGKRIPVPLRFRD